MKRRVIFSIVLILISVITTVLAENVVQQPYTIITSDSSYDGLYTGAWSHNQPEGYGIFVSKSNSGVPWHYVGTWKNGSMDGEGATYWNDGTLQVGLYKRASFIDGYSISGESQTISNTTPTSAPTAVKKNSSNSYIGNQNSYVFHLPSCQSVKKMKEKNKFNLSSRDEAIRQGYRPCRSCNP